MKLLFSAICLVAGLGSAIFFLTRPDFPVDREIVSKDGRKLAATILGKENDVITVERFSDRARFQIPSRNLAWTDQFFVFRLREEAPPPPPKTKNKDAYIENRERLIDQLRKKADLYRREIASNTLTDLLHTNRQTQLLEIEKEIRALQVAIDNYQYRTKQK